MDYRKNNFDFLRLLFASFVIITHSYPLSGLEECDWLCQLTNGQMGLSYLGVKGFFVISGYLIYQSSQRSDSVIDYFWKRILRLFPALIVILFLTVILVPFVYQSEISIFQNRSILTYIPNNVSLYRLQYGIDGVFEENPYPSAINGSLWTIAYEFTMYVFISFFVLFKMKKSLSQIVLSVSFVLLLTCIFFYFEAFKQYEYLISAAQLLDLGCFFIAGSLLAAVNIEKLHGQRMVLITALLIILASVYYNVFNLTMYVTLPIFVILAGLNPIPYISTIGNKIGDLSYGIYIYGFPVQQTLMFYFKLNHIELMIYSLLISYFFAYFSWHLIEKKALKFKKIDPTKLFISDRLKYKTQR